MKKITIIFSLLAFSFLVNNSVNAQMECRSMLGAHLTPFTENSPFTWAVEGTMAPGIMTSPYDTLDNAKLNGGMLLGALEFSFAETNHIYLEGGYKNWGNSALVNDKKLTNRHLGVRQFFYSYAGKKLNLKIGLHETRLGDFFLVDERVLGVSADKEFGAFNFNVRGGTVLKNFARMGQFCANRHLYGIINPDYTEKIGKKIGETNLAGLVINWNPHYTAEEPNTSDDNFTSMEDSDFENNEDDFHVNHDFNEFSDDADEFAKENNEPFIMLSNIGVILYDEFGKNNYIPDNKFYVGALFDFQIAHGLFFQTGPVYQSMTGNNTMVYIFKLGESITWNNASNTKFSGAFIGKYDIDDNAIFQPLFSNLFLGEIMRLDAANFPLWQAAIKHRFPGTLKFRMALKAVGQIDSPNTNEQNIEFGILVFNNHLKATLIGSRVQTDALPKEFYTVRLEGRLAF